ncbi:hypothetical protein TRIUR3_29032 [Triticum urartu]|uniref:Uncharacterized protein n=1 Tax=Triticum urartu TaxID=4572 RepID=M7ZUZ6_TRIUA|nr:hypothetical protein TRIUR3_29032 [Triticum urartu]
MRSTKRREARRVAAPATKKSSEEPCWGRGWRCSYAPEIWRTKRRFPGHFDLALVNMAQLNCEALELEYSRNCHLSAPSEQSSQTGNAIYSTQKKEIETRVLISSAEVSWAFRFAQIGGGIEDCGTYLGAWETSLRERSQFFLWVSGYVPEGEFPEIVLWMARACRGMSQVLGQLARMAKGASGLCRLVGGEIKRLAQGYVQGTLQQVVATNRGSLIRLQIDVDPAMTPSLAKTCFELLNAEGAYGQEMMQNAQNMITKLAEHEEMSARRRAPRSLGT